MGRGGRCVVGLDGVGVWLMGIYVVVGVRGSDVVRLGGMVGDGMGDLDAVGMIGLVSCRVVADCTDELEIGVTTCNAELSPLKCVLSVRIYYCEILLILIEALRE